MFNAKALVLIQSLLWSLCVFAQVPTPNTTLYIPGDNDVTLSVGEFLVASEITVSDSTTLYQLVDNNPSMTATITVGLSPSGATYHLVEDVDGGEVDVDETCIISAGFSTCTLIGKQVSPNTTTTVTATFVEPTSGLPVVALNFGSTTTTTSSSTPTGPSPTNTPKTNSAVNLESGVLIKLVLFLGLAFRLM